MKVFFLQDGYMDGYAWEAFKKGLDDGTLNLSLYLEKYINESVLIDSSNTAKRFEFSLIAVHKKYEKALDNIKKLKSFVEKTGTDNNRRGVKKGKVLGIIEKFNRNLSQGNFDDLKFKRGDITAVCPQNHQIKAECDAQIKSILSFLNAIKSRDYKIKPPKKALDEYDEYNNMAKHGAIVKITEVLQDQGKEKDFFELAKEVQDWFEGAGKSDEINDLSIKVNAEEVLAEVLRNIFGTQEREGLIIFFDAFPDSEKLNTILELDTMNPHYQEYYLGSPKGPGDWLQPNPVIFLTVPTGVTFSFAVAHRNSELKEALKEFGVGAKTALGYGRFDSIFEK